MLKRFLKFSAALLLLILISSSSVLASGKMEIKLGDKVSLQAEDGIVGTYKWVVRRGKEILSTQGTSVFTYTFNQQGEFEVVLTITDNAGKTRSTTVFVLVGDRYSLAPGGTSVEGGVLDVPLSVGLATLPTRSSQRTVHILGDEGRVVFDIGVREDILEYRIDRNIFVDSDGNGIANDDIDNADHTSYLLGGIYQTKYLASESNKIAAEVTIVNNQGQKAKSQVEIIFESLPDKEGNVVAVLDTLPLIDNEDKKIYLYEDPDVVAFYPRRSQGDIIEYRIDRNIFVDSDGDGNPSNDIDNKDDPSFKNGDVWTTAYSKTDDQIIAQLIVVGRGGAGSRIQREIDFTDRPPVIIPDTSNTESIISLISDKEFVQKGDPIDFAVEGLAQSLDNYVFNWDFNGDGEVDQTVEGDNSVSYIYDTPGIQPVTVKVQDADGNEAIFNLDMLVKDIEQTTADFEYAVDGNLVTFTNLSTVSPNLTSKNLSYSWSFGETDPTSFEAQKDQTGLQNPSFTYAKPGTYIATLTVVDVDQVASTKVQEILIEGLGEDAEVTAELEEEKVKKDGSIIGSIFKWILYIILTIFFLLVLLVLGLLVFLKIQHPDLVFEELIDELKIKLLAMMGVHENLTPSSQPAGTAQSETKTPQTPEQQARAAAAKAAEEEKLAEEEAVATPEVAEESVVNDQVQQPPSPAEESVEVIPEPIPEAELVAEQPTPEPGPVPEWLKQTGVSEAPTVEPAPTEAEASQVIEGEVEEGEEAIEMPAAESEPAPEPEPKLEPTPVEAPVEAPEAQVTVPEDGSAEAAPPSVEEPATTEQAIPEEASKKKRRRRRRKKKKAATDSPVPEVPAESQQTEPEPPTQEAEKPLGEDEGPTPDWLKNA